MVFSSDVESLKRGIIKTSKNIVQTSYTILLVGETGVGKSSVLELIANVLAGNDIDHYDRDILDHTNEAGGSESQSQTKQARLYEFKSSNDILVSTNIFERIEYG
jgi:stage III sporulation protein SpoIIIAA